MGKYTVIDEISEQLLKVLREQLVPELVTDPNSIRVCRPEGREDLSLSVFLYDIQESDEVRQFGMQDLSESRQQYPPVYLTLYFMLTPHFPEQTPYGMMQEARLLGKVIQYFHDYPGIRLGEEQYPVQMLKLPAEEKMKLWNSDKKPYTLSLFYRISPVPLESARIRSVNRVKHADFKVEPAVEEGRQTWTRR